MAKLPPINENQVTTYGKSLSDAGSAAATIERKTSAIKNFLGWAQEKGYVDGARLSLQSDQGLALNSPQPTVIEIPPPFPSQPSQPSPNRYRRTGIFLVLTGATLVTLLFVVAKRDQVVRLVQNFAQQEQPETTDLAQLRNPNATPPASNAATPTPSLPAPTSFPSSPSQPSVLSDSGILSRNGPIKIEGTSLTLDTAPFSNGNITLAPDGQGQLLIRSSTTNKSSIDISNANLTTGDLIHANVGNANTGYNFLKFTNGPNELLHFQVDADGNTYVGGNETVEGTLYTDKIDPKTTGGAVNFSGNINFEKAASITTSNGNLTLQPTSGILNIPVSIQNLSTTNQGRVQIDDTVQLNGTLFTRGISAHGFVQVDDGLAVTGTVAFANLNTPGAVLYTTNTSGTVGNTAQGTTGQCLLSAGSGTPTWQSCGTSYWSLTNGALYPVNATVDLLIGGTSTASAKFAFINVSSGTPTASIAGNLTLDSAGVIQTTKNQALTIGGNSTGNITLSPLNGTGTVSISPFTTAGTVVYNTNTSGTLGITAQGTSGQCLTSAGSGTPTWTTCATGANNLWTSGSGAIFPLNSTMDLLVGGQSTASAKFAFINVSNGTPTASISGTTTNVATYITGEGNLQVTNQADLSLAGTTTGQVNVLNRSGSAFTTFDTINSRVGIGTTSPLAPLSFAASAATVTSTPNKIQLYDGLAYGFGVSAGALNYQTAGEHRFYTTSTVLKMVITGTGTVGIGTGTPLATLDVRRTSGTIPVASISGSTSEAALVVDQSGIGDLITASTSGTQRMRLTKDGELYLSSLTTAGAVVYTNASGQLLDTAQGTSGQCLLSGGSGTPTWSSCSAAADNFWQRNSGVLSPVNITDDLAIGGTATSSAKFQAFGVESTTGNIVKLTSNTITTGNVLSATSSAITSGNILKLGEGGDQTFSGNVILADIDNTGGGGGTFTGNFLQLNNAGTLKMKITGSGQYVINNSVSDAAIAGGASLGLGTDSSNNVILRSNGKIDLRNSTELQIPATVTYAAGNGTLQVNNADANSITQTNGSGTGAFTSIIKAGGAQAANDLFRITDNSNNILAKFDSTGGFAATNSGITAGNILSATSSAITSGNLLKLSEGGNQTFSGNVIYADIDNTGGGGGAFTGNFLKFDKAGSTIVSVNSSGTITSTGYNTAGGIIYAQTGGILAVNAQGTASQCLLSGGSGTPTWGSCSSSQFWQENLGVLSPVNITDDLAIGGTATSSALFQVFGSGTNAGDVDISSQLAIGNSGTITAGQVLRVDNGYTDTSGSVFGAYFVNRAQAGSASTAKHFGLTAQSRLETTNGPSQLYGVEAIANVAAAGTVGQTTGLIAEAFINEGIAGTVTDMTGIWVYNPDAEDGTVTNAFGISVDSPSVDTGSIGTAVGIDIDAGTLGAGSIGDLYGLNIDADSRTVTNGKYGLHIGTMSGGANNYQLYIVGTADSYFAGKIGIADTSPDAKLEVLSTTEQLRLTETDNTNDCRFTVDSSGNLTINCTGTKTIIADDLQITGNDILDSGAVTRLTIGATNTFNGRLAVANNGLAAVGLSLSVFDQYEQQDILTASASGIPRAAIERTGDYKMFGPKTQSTIASINDVFMYDTTADSDGGAWTTSDGAKASSWYNETIDNTGVACVIGTDDRCGKKEFPKRAVIEADASNVRIYNAEDQTMWMRLSQGTTALGADANNDPQTVFALNGRIYIGTSGSSTTGLYVIDLKADTIRRYNTTNRSLSDQRVSGRNSTNTYTAESTIMKLPSAVINDVKAARIDGKDYVVVGTNGGSTGAVSLIQEETKKIANFGAYTSAIAATNVFLLSDGTLYYTYRSEQHYNATKTNDVLKVNYAAHKQMPVDANINARDNVPADVVYGNTTVLTAPNTTATKAGVSFGDAASATTSADFAPGPTFPDNTPVVNDLFVTKGASTADPSHSNAIYLATNDGLVRIDEYQSQLDYVDKTSHPYTNYGYPINETKGNVKYYTKDYISEAMYGDIRGMWPLNNANSSSDFEDVSVKANTLTGTNITAAGDSASGVRSTTTDFDGSTEYMSSTSTSLLPAAAVSVGAWVNPATATTQKQVIAGKGGDLTNKAYRLGLHGTTPYFEVSENGSDVFVATASAALSTSNWHYVVGVFKPSDRNQGDGSLDLYVDGALVGHSYNAPNRLYNSPSLFEIGKDDQYHTGVTGTDLDATFKIVTVTSGIDPRTIFKVGDFLNVRNTTVPSNTQTVVTAVSSTTFTVLDAVGTATTDDTITTKVNYGNPLLAPDTDATFKIHQGITQEDFRIGDLVEAYDSTGTTLKTQTVVSAQSETSITTLAAVANATTDDIYFVKLNTTPTKFGTALDATFKIITGPNQNEFSVGDVVQVSRAANAGAAPTSSTLTVVTAVSATTITVLDAVGSVTTDDTWTVKVNKYGPIDGTDLDATFKIITGPNNTQFAPGDLVEVYNSSASTKTQTTVTAASTTTITVTDAVGTATTDDTKVSKLSVASTPTEYFGGKIDDAFVSASALTTDQVKTVFTTGQAALQNHTASRVTGVTGADSYQQLAGAGTSAATVNTVKAVAVDDRNQFMYVGTNDSSANTGGVSVLGVNTDTLHDLYDDTNNTTKKDDSAAQFDATDVVALSIHGSEPRYLAIAGTNDTTTKLWLENSDTSLKSHLANNVDPHGATLNQTNLKVDNTLVLGESGEANLTAAGTDVKLSGNLQVTGNTVFGKNILPNSYASGIRSSARRLFTESTTWLAGQYNSMALGADDLPRIVTYDSYLGELYYVRCLKTDCTSYAIQLLDDGDPSIENDNVGLASEIIMGPDNLPYIAYNNVTRTGITYIRCLDQNCSNRVKRIIDEEDSIASATLSIGLAVNSRGFPVFAYVDDTLSRIRVATCADRDCNQVTVRQIGEAATDIDGHIALALDSNDFPIMAYQDVTAAPDLWLTACNDADCSTFSTNTVAATANNIGNDVQLAIGTDDLPRLTHRDVTATNVYFIKCTTRTCSSITPAAPGLLLDGDGVSDAGSRARTDIVMDASNNSYVAYWESATAGGGAGNLLGFVQVNDTPAISSGPTQIDNVSDTVGDHISLALNSNGVPVIMHRNVTLAGVRLTNCGNATCTSGNTSQNIFSHFSSPTAAGKPGFAMAVGNDNMIRMAIDEATDSDLLYVRCLDLECAGIVVTTVDSLTADTGNYPSIAIGQDGFARIAYQDVTNTNLKYAQCQDIDCTTATLTSISDVSSAGVSETNTGRGNTIVIGEDGFARILTFGSTVFEPFFIRCLNDACTAYHANQAGLANCTANDQSDQQSAMLLDPNGLATMAVTCIQSGVVLKIVYIHCTDIDCTDNDGVTTLASNASIRYSNPGIVWNPVTNAPIVSVSPSVTTSTELFVCADTKTCADNTIVPIEATNTTLYGTHIDPNTNLPVIFLRTATTQIGVVRCTDPYCEQIAASGNDYGFTALGSTITEGTSLIRQVNGVSLYSVAVMDDAALYFVNESATIDIGNADHPFGALFTNILVARNQTVLGIDLAENYKSIEPLGAGDVVAFDSTAATQVKKTNIANDRRLAGVVSTKPGLLLQDTQNKDGMYPIALVGRVPVKIASNSAAIAIGDPLTSSSYAGKAQKQMRAGQSIGKALEDWTPESGKDKIEVFVNLGYADPEITLTDAGEILITATDSGLLAFASPSGSLVYKVTDAAGDIINRVGVFSDAVIGNVRAGAITTKELATDSLTITGQTLKDYIISVVSDANLAITPHDVVSPVAHISSLSTDVISPIATDSAGIAVQLGEGQRLVIASEAKQSLEIATGSASPRDDILLDVRGSATVAGTLYADRIVTRFGEIGELKTTTVSATYITNITNIFDSFPSSPSLPSQPSLDSTGSALLALGVQPDTNTPTLTISKPITLASNFNVLGDTTLGRTTIAGNLLVDATIHLSSNGLETISDTLFIQKSKLEPVDIMNGALVVNTAGNVFINGNLMVKGTLATNIISPIAGDLTIDLASFPSSPSGSFSKFIIRGPNNTLAASIDTAGNATFSGALTTTKLVIADSAVSQASQSASTTSNAIIGTATLPAGNMTIDISTTKATKNSFIYITPITSTANTVLYVKSKSEGIGFTVAVDQPVANDVQFNWWIVN